MESATSLMDALFFDTRRYDISAVGRYKYNKKLNIWRRITGQQAGKAVADPMTGEVLAEAGEILSRAEGARRSPPRRSRRHRRVQRHPLKVFSNGMVDMPTLSISRRSARMLRHQGEGPLRRR